MEVGERPAGLSVEPCALLCCPVRLTVRCLFPEAGAGPALLTAARDRGHGRGPSLTPQAGGAAPGLAAPPLRKLLFVGFSFCLRKFTAL